MSFYYCFGPAAPGEPERLEALVAEVHNTPWDERYCSVLPREGGTARRTLRFREEEAFFVSPFMGMDQTYDWKVTEPGETLHVSIANEGAGTGALLRRLPRPRAARGVPTFLHPDGGMLAAARSEAP